MLKQDKITRSDNKLASSTKRLHSLKATQKKENSFPDQNEKVKLQGLQVNHEFHDTIARNDRIVECDVPIDSIVNNEYLDTDVVVGAFAVSGFGGGINDEEELSLPNGNLSMSHPISVEITNVQIVNDEIVYGVPVKI
jgi:hypothetical protein